jgi:hypothetical protein
LRKAEGSIAKWHGIKISRKCFCMRNSVHWVYGPWTVAGLGPPWTRPHTASGLLITAALPGSNDWERMTEVVAVLPLVHGGGAVGVWPELHSGVRRHTAIGRRE